MSLVFGFRLDNLRGDFYGGIVAAVVALPLALAFGVASGAGAIAGLYGAIFVGFFAALFGGTPAQCSGPTGPMTVVMAGTIALFAHEPGLAFTTVILGGLFQILFGVFRFGQYISLVPYPVISGFMSGIGLIIIILQVGPLLGHATKPEGVLANLRVIPKYIAEPEPHAVSVALLTIAILYLTPARLGKVIPPPLLALIAGTLMVHFFFPEAPVIGKIPEGFPSLAIPEFTFAALALIIEEALVLAVLGSIDSLLTSLVCDNMTRIRHDSNRELIGQGIGNIASGLFGGLPGAGATMRSVANIRTGGRTPISGMLHALVLLAVLLGLGPLAGIIPLAVLAGILFKVGFDIIDWRFLKHLIGVPPAEVVVMALVLLTTVFVDLITGVAAGVVTASLLFVKRMADLELANLNLIRDGHPEIPLNAEESEVMERNQGRVLLIHIDGPMSFGSAKNIVRRLEADPVFNSVQSIVLDLSAVYAFDGTAAMAIDDMLQMTQEKNQHLLFVGMQPQVTEVLDGLAVLARVHSADRFRNRLNALRHAAYVGGSPHPEDVPSAEL
ncbi:MAG: SulP family inorganic anion transporter [Methylococcaceae bacterium]|nr:SulP family inorganic anion transporter [Methylococcaceae bacterium]